MPFDGSGNFTLTQDFPADRDAGFPASKIQADLMDNVLEDLAAGLEQCINRFGENPVAANINWGGFKITNYGAASAAADVPNARQIANNALQYGGTTGGSADAYTLTQSLVGPVQTGTRLLLIANFTNSGASTFNLNGVGAVAIKRKNGDALSADDITSGQFFELTYDGTNYILFSLSNLAAAASGANTDITSLAALTSINTGPLRAFTNYLLNPNGQIVDGIAGAAASAAYGQAAAWYVEAQSNPIALTNTADVADGTPFMVRATQSNASEQRMGAAQCVESIYCKSLRGKQVTLSGKVRQSSIANSTVVRYAILGWTGTADTVTRQLVADWTNGTFTTGNFFASTTLTLYGAGSTTLGGTGLLDLTALTITLGSTFNNLFVMIWTDNTVAQNVTLDFALQLEVGGKASVFELRPLAIEERLWQRYFEKSSPLATPPLTASDLSFTPVVLTTSIPNNANYLTIMYKVEKRISVAPVTFPFTTPSNTNRWSNNAGTDYGASSASPATSNKMSFSLANGSGGALTVVANVMVGGWYCDARL